METQRAELLPLDVGNVPTVLFWDIPKSMNVLVIVDLFHLGGNF
jgi:hypothetical protein